MRISTKARYGLFAITAMAETAYLEQCTTVISLSEKLNISKIYLEQVFGLLKRGGIVGSIKGAQGGYYLVKPIEDLTVYDVLVTVEPSLFEKTEATVGNEHKTTEEVIFSEVFDVLDNSVKETLTSISFEDIVNHIKKHGGNESYMYYL